jgi:hypothetical protein
MSTPLRRSERLAAKRAAFLSSLDKKIQRSLSLKHLTKAEVEEIHNAESTLQVSFTMILRYAKDVKFKYSMLCSEIYRVTRNPLVLRSCPVFRKSLLDRIKKIINESKYISDVYHPNYIPEELFLDLVDANKALKAECRRLKKEDPNGFRELGDIHHSKNAYYNALNKQVYYEDIITGKKEMIQTL